MKKAITAAVFIIVAVCLAFAIGCGHRPDSPAASSPARSERAGLGEHGALDGGTPDAYPTQCAR